MLALMIPTIGMPFFETIPEKHRGNFVSIVVREDKAGAHLPAAGSPFYMADVERTQFVRVDFVWCGQFKKRSGEIAFDVFEESGG
jgi:hypothetical protein